MQKEWRIAPEKRRFCSLKWPFLLQFEAALPVSRSNQKQKTRVRKTAAPRLMMLVLKRQRKICNAAGRCTRFIGEERERERERERRREKEKGSVCLSVIVVFLFLSYTYSEEYSCVELFVTAAGDQCESVTPVGPL